jgi:PAS domain S-box-containing protein
MKIRSDLFLNRPILTLLIPLITLTLLLSGFVWMWYETNSLSYKFVKSNSKNVIQEASIRLETLLYERSKDLAHLASLFQHYDTKTSEERFSMDAKGILSREKLFYAMGKLNLHGTFDIRIPSDTINFPVVITKIPYHDYLQLLSKTNISSLVSYPVVLNDTSSLLVIFQAIYNSDSSAVTGAVTGILYVKRVIETIKSSSFPSDYQLTISIDNHILYTNKSQFTNKYRFLEIGNATITFQTMGRNWTIEASPPAKGTVIEPFVQNNHRLILNVLLSIIVSSLLGAALFLVMQSRKIQEQLSKSAQRYRLITENAKEIIFRMSLPEGKYEYISPSCEYLTGYSLKDFYNTPNFLRTIIDPSFISYFDNNWRELLKGNDQPTFEYKIVHKNRDHYWLHQKNTILKDQFGKPIALEGVISDNTIQKTSEIEKEKLIRELEEKNNDLERFIYIISHELKTPLITIKGFLGYLEEEAVRGDLIQLHQDIVRIVSATETMQRQLNNLIEINRIGRNRSKSEFIDAFELVFFILDSLKPVLDSRSIRVEVQKLPSIIGFRSEIQELFQNVIENAIRFTTNQKDPHIQIGTIEFEKEQLFFIKDNGIGIPSQYKNRIFGLFNKLDPHSEGTGAGLAIAKRVAEHHGGWIKVESEGPGKGSTFFFKLPLGE